MADLWDALLRFAGWGVVGLFAMLVIYVIVRLASAAWFRSRAEYERTHHNDTQHPGQ